MRLCISCLVALCAVAFSRAIFGAENATPLITHGDPVALPGIGRVIFGFLVTVVVAAGVIYALRRWLPTLTNRYGAHTAKYKVETSVQNGLRLHTVTIDQNTILIAEGKTGIAMIPLAGKTTTSSSAES